MSSPCPASAQQPAQQRRGRIAVFFHGGPGRLGVGEDRAGVQVLARDVVEVPAQRRLAVLAAEVGDDGRQAGLATQVGDVTVAVGDGVAVAVAVGVAVAEGAACCWAGAAVE